MSGIKKFAPPLDYYLVLLPKAVKSVCAIFEVGFREDRNSRIHFGLEELPVKIICYQKVKCIDMKIQSWEIVAGLCMLLIQQIL
jgi:hypothetical protein